MKHGTVAWWCGLCAWGWSAVAVAVPPVEEVERAAVPLVEVGAADEREGWSPHDIQPLEDAVAQAYDGVAMKVETRRARLGRTPPAIYAHAQALQECVNPRWTRARVTQCVQAVQWPSPFPKRPSPQRATHLLRISHRKAEDGTILALSLTSLGRVPEEKVARRVLAEDATPADQRQAVLELAGELLGPMVRREPP